MTRLSDFGQLGWWDFSVSIMLLFTLIPLLLPSFPGTGFLKLHMNCVAVSGFYRAMNFIYLWQSAIFEVFICVHFIAIYFVKLKTIETIQSAEYDKRVANISLFIYIELPGLHPNSRQAPGSSRQLPGSSCQSPSGLWTYIYIYIWCRWYRWDTSVCYRPLKSFAIKMCHLHIWLIL